MVTRAALRFCCISLLFSFVVAVVVAGSGSSSGSGSGSCSWGPENHQSSTVKCGRAHDPTMRLAWIWNAL